METYSKAFHDSALSHVMGRSKYVEDEDPVFGQLYVDIFPSPVAKGRLISVDTSKAEALPEVAGVYLAKDLSHNRWGAIVQDQPLLVEEQIEYLGEPIAVIAAKTPEAAYEARTLIEAKIEKQDPILTMKDALDQASFFDPEMKIETGDVEAAFKDAPHMIEGESSIGGQEHFYLESQSVMVYPGEGAEVVVHSSTQHPSEVQHSVAHALGISYSDVVCYVKRMGGAFGGKESQSTHFACLCALAAAKTGKVCRLHLSKDDDMAWTGKRHAFLNRYKVAFDNQGKILGLKIKLCNDGGAYLDLSAPILQRAMLHIDNSYYLANASIEGKICRTNFPPNTAFRGFGGPQGLVQTECIIEEIAAHLGMDALDVRLRNLYGHSDGMETPYGQKVENNLLPEIFESLEKSSKYRQRRKEITAFNQENKGKLRGLSLTPVKFGISFTVKFLNQGNALVNVHRDGTIQVSTGATEMGQGVNTKIAIIVAECFGLAVDRVRVMPTSTEKNHNTSATAASAGSDINGAAALIAAEKIKKKLAIYAKHLLSFSDESRPNPITELFDYEIDESEDAKEVVFEGGDVYLKGNPKQKLSFASLVDASYHNRISLGDYGYYKTKGLHFDRDKGKGQPFLYYTFGAAVSEVEIDRYTGECKILSSEILMDLGRMIQKGIDEGQVAGGFIQGCGWVLTEELCYDEDGRLLSHSPTTYKIPNIQDTPRHFSIDFIENTSNTQNVRGSKAVGEPPFLLCASVWAAVKSALQEVRGDLRQGLPLPATGEAILRALET